MSDLEPLTPTKNPDTLQVVHNLKQEISRLKHQNTCLIAEKRALRDKYRELKELYNNETKELKRAITLANRRKKKLEDSNRDLKRLYCE